MNGWYVRDNVQTYLAVSFCKVFKVPPISVRAATICTRLILHWRLPI